MGKAKEFDTIRYPVTARTVSDIAIIRRHLEGRVRDEDWFANSDIQEDDASLIGKVLRDVSKRIREDGDWPNPLWPQNCHCRIELRFVGDGDEDWQHHSVAPFAARAHQYGEEIVSRGHSGGPLEYRIVLVEGPMPKPAILGG